MQFNFSENINNFLKIVVESAKARNINVYFVGGIVRDNILNIPTKDIDIIVDANAIDFVRDFPDVIKIKSIHEDFCTVKAEYNNICFDIASTRIEKYPYSGCLPQVNEVGVDIKQDYLRRDFTVNSLYAKIDIQNNKLKYDLIDLCNGIDDIKNRTLRVLHNKSYIDDPTRILRGLNFKYRFGFDFSKNDKSLINEYIKNPDIKNASIDRITAVFRHILSGDNSGKLFEEIIKNKYYKLLNSNINCDIKLASDIIKRFPMADRGEFCMKILLDKDIDKIELNSDIEIKHAFSKLHDYELAYYYYKTNDKNALKYLDIANINLNINGKDLINIGYLQGADIGLILDKLLEYKIKSPEKLTNKEQELDWVIKNYPIST